ncbi:MAG: 4-(cytidine 5'-diphospho)-2-C-methyl-D-erythritol kinase [Lachnospiraceae bacterium]|nr:4-(cytidine 5'-diphospho)-2-C-methyl-D-erythritol kinase [Lachnospiraceae bacterium]
MQQIRLKAYGKVNLCLDIVGKRDNGYHDLRMVMQTVNLYDSIYMKKSENPGITLTSNVSWLPCDEGNLAWRAAKLLTDEFAVTEGVEISLYKYLPVAAGMAGGSADCATVLFGMNRLFELGLSRQELMVRGLTLGSDVPYCLMRGTALAEGIGEQLTRLPDVPSCPVLIAKPPVSVSTKEVYQKFRLPEVREHPDVNGMVRAIREGNLDGICSRMGNVLETVTERDYPVIRELKDRMKVAGAANALMSGSGPTVFGLFPENAKAAERAKEEILGSGLARQVYVTEFFPMKSTVQEVE